MSLIEVKNLSIGYGSKVVAGHLDFEIEASDYLYIIGENGVGKTTLMKTLLGLMPPVAGEILWGEDLLANEIGYLPQQTVVQKDFPASVEEIVQSGCLNRCGWRPFYNRHEKKRAVESMEKLGILDMRKHCYRELSGGQQQRVLLARALCASKRILLLDEPVVGLDPRATKEMYELITKMKEDGMAIMMISHDMSAVNQYASKVLYVSSKPRYFDTLEDYRGSELAKFLNMTVEVAGV